jgi:hypothetical protein
LFDALVEEAKAYDPNSKKSWDVFLRRILEFCFTGIARKTLM